MAKIYCLTLLIFLTSFSSLKAQTTKLTIPPFSVDFAASFSRLTYDCINMEYPNRIAHTMQSADDVASPQKLHPAFYGCFDWHSSVHGHWMLVKILQNFPELPDRELIITAIDQHITKEHIDAEISYFQKQGRASFERPYGWAWLLKLTAELANSDTEYESRWFANLQPLAKVIESLYYDYLPGLYYPIRKGGYHNTAFGIAFALDYARAINNTEFENFLKERARSYFMNDNKIPASWEPDGDDFLSPSLVEADLMRRVLSREEFVRWFKDYMPEIPYSLTDPVGSDRNGHIEAHLVGLNLSRAWCMFELAKALPDDSQYHRDLWQAGYRHAAESLPYVISNNYLGTHWLSTFATYMYLSLSDIEE
jgi:hypothetical protein